MTSRHLPNYYSTPNTTLYSSNTKDWLHSNDYSMNHHTDMMDTEEALKNFQDYSITPTPSLTSNKARLTFLISENHRLKFEEENQKNFYYESRKNLQDCWNKLVNLRSHLQRFQEEIEEVKIEIIAHEAERSIWTGDIDEIFEQSEYRNGGNSSGHDWTLKSATRVAGLRNLRDKVKLKESIQSKILIFQEELSHKKQLLTKLSVQLQQSTTKVSSDLFTSSETSFLGLMSIDESMGIRAQLLTISDQIDDLELKIRQYKQSLGQLEREVNEHVDEVVWQEIENDQSFSKLNSHKKSHSRTPNRSFTSGNGNQSMSKNPIASAVSLSENEYLELVSHGPPLSTDLINALLKRNSDPSDDKAGEDSLFSTSLSASALLHLQQSSDHATIPEFTLDEILAGQAKVYRMNGELPQTYLTRLEKRILALQLVEIEVVKEFQELLNTVKRRREMLKDVENKRLKVELLLSNEDKTKVAISTNIRSEVLQTPSISTATGEKSFGQIPATPATMATPGLLSQSTLKVTNHHPEYYMSAEEVKETHDRIPAHSTTTPYRTSSIVTSPEKPIPAQEHHIITTSHSNSGGFNTPSATPHHPPSSSVTSGSVFTFNTDRVQTPESISTIHKYSSVPHRSFEKERAPSPPTPLTTGATTPVTATNNAGGNNNAVDMNNELAQNLRSMIRKKLSASMFEGSDQPQNSPVGKKPHKALIEEETEILALISLYLTTATSSSLPSTPSGKSKASGFHPTSTLLAQLNKSPRQQREKEKADLENEHPNDSPTIDPKLMKSLKMQVLSRLLQENFPDLTPQLEKINRSSKDKEAHDFSDNEDDADGVVFQSAYVSPRDTAMSKKINTDPIKIQTGNKRKSKKSVIPQDPVPDAKNPPPLSSNANNNLTKPSEEQKIKEKSGKVESAAKNSTKAATPVSTNVHTMTSPSPHKTPNFQSPESGSAMKRYQSCPICASLPKRPPLDFSEFREERRRNKALALQATSHAATPETQGKESFHRHENNGDIIYVSSKHDAAYTSPKDIKTSSNNKARTALSSPPLSTAEPAPVALQVVTAPKPPPSSSVGTSPINRSTSFGMIKKDASTSPFPQRDSSRITEIDPNHKELEEKLREEYFQKITQETERQLQDWKTKFFENPENENATDDEENENEDETADYESSNTNSSRLVNSRTQTPTIGRTTAANRPKSAQTASIPIRKSKSVDAIPRPSEVKTEVKTSPHISQPSTSLSISDDSLPVKRENIVNHANSSPNLHSSPTSKKNQARSPILTAAKASSSPPRNDLQASRRRDINRDAIRDVTAKLCQLAVDLEKSALENDENLEEEIQTISTAALPQNGLQRMSRDNTSMNAVLAELLQLVKLQQEELHHLRNVQETFFRTNASLTTSLQSSLNASDGAKGFARSSLLSSQESIQTIHPSVIDSRQPRFSEGSRNELEHEEEKLEEQSKSEEELEEEEVEEKKVHERSGAHEPGKMKKVGGTEENEVQALLSWINMIENQNHAHNAPEYNHQDQILAKHNPRYKVTSEEVQQLITLLEEKYRSIQQELTQPHQRKHHSSPQKKLSSSSSITASSTLEVEVILARHLPAMKHMSRSSDAYVELILLTFHPTIPVLSSKLNDDFKNHGEYEEAEEGRGEEEQKGNESSNRWKQNIPEVLAHFTDVDYNILNGNCVIRADMEFTVMEEVYGCIPVVIGYQRTSVQSETLYPNWRESFKFSLEEKELIAKEGKSMNNPFVEGSVLPSLNLQQRQQSVTVLWCLVRDSTRNGHQLRYKDEIIAQSAYQVDSEQFVFPSSTGHHPSSNLLPATSIKASAANSAASSYFHVTLSLYPPHSMKWRKGRVAIDPRAELKLGLQCFLSLERQYTLLQKEILSLLSALEELPALTSEEFEELGDIIPKAKNQKIKQIPELYWMDSPICFRIYRVFKHFKPQSSTETSHLRRSHESIPDNAPAIKRKKLNTHEEIAPVGRSHSISPQRTNHFKEELRHNEPSVPARKSNIFSSQPRSRSAEQSSAYVSEPAMPHPAMARPSPMKIIGLVERNKSPPFVLRSYDPPPKKPVSSRSWNSSKSAVPPNFLNTSLQNSYDDRPLQSVHHPDVIEAIDEPAPSPRKRGSVSPQKVVSRPKPKPQLKEESMDLSKLNRSVDLSIFKKSGNNYSSQVAVKAFANPHANQAKIKKKENGWR